MAAGIDCPRCGAELSPTTTEGLCPHCLMAEAIGGDEEQIISPAYAPTVHGQERFVAPEIESLSHLFPHLEFISVLGHGGMGAVYKVRQKKLDRFAALKIIRPESAVDPAFAERFNREAKTLARLSHPNIVGIYDFGEVEFVEPGQNSGFLLYYFLMEFVDGVNLRQVIQSGRASSRETLAIVPQICDALQYAHAQGVVHRDIKPENILLDSGGHVKIADFGLAKFGTEDNGFGLTATHQVLGTVRYMAPEQMAQSSTVDHRADIYSLGVVFYEMLTGEIPAGAFDPPSRRAGIDARLDQVVMRAMASNPDRRYQSAGEIRGEVSRISSTSFERSDNGVSERRPMPGPSTIIDNGAAAVAAGFRGLFISDPDDTHAESDSDHFVSIPLSIAEAGQLPDICMVCGQPTRRRQYREFEYTSEGRQGLIALFIILFFPIGIAMAIMFPKKVRMACPVCPKHRRHWSSLAWFAGTGWLLILTGVGLGILLGGFTEPGPKNVWILVGSILTGIALYVIPLIRLATTRVAVEEISAHSIVLKRVSGAFAEALRVSVK